MKTENSFHVLSFLHLPDWKLRGKQVRVLHGTRRCMGGVPAECHWKRVFREGGQGDET